MEVRTAGDPVDGDPGAVLATDHIGSGFSSLPEALVVSPHSGADGLVHGQRVALYP